VAEIRLVSVGTSTRAVIFVHGVQTARGESWTDPWTAESGFFWPKGVAEERPTWTVACLQYQAGAALRMPTVDLEARGQNLLDRIESSPNLRDKQLAVVAHSFGGLVTKEMIRTSYEQERYQAFLNRLAGVVFIATPHWGSAVAPFLRRIRFLFGGTLLLKTLSPHARNLMELSDWFRSTYQELGFSAVSFGEHYPTRPRYLRRLTIFPGIRVVDMESADPKLPGVRVTGIDADHMTIAKPVNQSSHIFESTLKFLDDTFYPSPSKPDPPFVGRRFFQVDLSSVRNHKLDSLRDAPRGRVLLDGVPFYLTSEEIRTQQIFLEHYPTHISISVDVPDPSIVHILINGGYVRPRFRGKKIGEIVLDFDRGTAEPFPLIAQENILEPWGYANSRLRIIPPQAAYRFKRVFVEEQVRGGRAAFGFLHKMSLIIPGPFRGATLKSIRVVDRSIEWVDSVDPSVGIQGITIERNVGQREMIPPAKVAGPQDPTAKRPRSTTKRPDQAAAGRTPGGHWQLPLAIAGSALAVVTLLVGGNQTQQAFGCNAVDMLRSGLRCPSATLPPANSPPQAATPIALSPGAQTQLDLTALFNHPLDEFNSPPVGKQILGGVQFNILPGEVRTQGDGLSTLPTEIRIEVNVLGASAVHLLINGGFVEPRFRDKQVGSIALTSATQQIHRVPLIAYQNISEAWAPQAELDTTYRMNPPQCECSWRRVWMEQQYRGGPAVAFLDLVTIPVPFAFRNEALTTITIEDTSTESVKSVNPSVGVVAITVEGRN
jgi:hypothetical protein